MLHHRLASHVVLLAKLAQGLPVPGTEPIQQLTPYRIGERAEDAVEAHVYKCNLWVTCFK